MSSSAVGQYYRTFVSKRVDVPIVYFFPRFPVGFFDDDVLIQLPIL